ncbi:cupin domain-containing protein [Candidatus Woesearchaeota archaeon]|nr:cupin domain-containing protein [Candidatus Woesearchaeota archaeon]
MAKKMLRASKSSDLVKYQKGSVVSKEIIRKGTGTVTLFAFDRGQGLSEHTAPFDALVYILGGEAEIFIDKKPFHLKEGEMIIMPANHPHSLKAKKQFKMMLVMIKS